MNPSLRPRPPGVAPRAAQDLAVALPDPSQRYEQDAEWCVARLGGRWEEVRFHDYHRFYEVEGLYEKVFYDILQCQSPAVVRRALEVELRATGVDPGELRVVDVGAGNGMMGQELVELGVGTVVGIDILAQAAQAAQRDRPGVYRDYLVCDLTDLGPDERKRLVGHRLNCLTCVAAHSRWCDAPTALVASAST